MSLKRYLFLMAISTILCWAAWITVLFYIDPTTTGVTGLWCFYLSIFFALLGTISLIGLVSRMILKNQEMPFKQVGISLRQALWFSILITLSLVLLGEKLFTWWSMLILLCGLIILEAFFLSRSFEKKAVRQTIAKSGSAVTDK